MQEWSIAWDEKYPALYIHDSVVTVENKALFESFDGKDTNTRLYLNDEAAMRLKDLLSFMQRVEIEIGKIASAASASFDKKHTQEIEGIGLVTVEVRD